MSTKSKQTFQQKLTQLEALLAWFESDTIELEEALAKYEQALELTHELEQQLQAAKNHIMVIEQKFQA